MSVLTPKTSRMAKRPVSKELKLFETLENLTQENLDPSSSFIQKFVACDLDLNSTQQSIIEEDSVAVPNSSLCESSDDRSCQSKGKSVSFCEEPNEINIIENSYEEEEEEEGFSVEDQDSEQEVEEEDNREEAYSSYNEESDQSYSEYEEDPDFRNAILRQTRERDAFSQKKEISGIIENAIMKKHGTEYLLLSEIKRSLELKERQLERERETFTEQQKAEHIKLKAEIQRVETQRKNLQRLIADYHKLKSSREESEAKMKELTEKLSATKLEMSKRITRWGDQQRKLEERVKNLEKENEELKKQKAMSQRPALLKRPPMRLNQNSNGKLKRIQFADEIDSRRNPNSDNQPQCNADAKQPSVNKVKIPMDTSKNDSGISTRSSDTTMETDECRKCPLQKSFSSNKLETPQYPREVCITDENADQAMPADYIEMKHPCGTITRVTKDNKHIRHVMVNNDVMDQFEDGSVRYYYRDLKFSQTTYPNGDEIIEYDSGAVETIRANGSKVYSYPDGLVKYVDKGEEEVCFSDGIVMRTSSNGECTITWPSGQKEVRTSTYVKRFYPNGTIKIMYSDGSEETRYYNGRIRRKKDGILIDDTKPKRHLKKVKNNALHSTI